MPDVVWTEELSKAEFDCSYTGENKMKADFMEALQNVREEAAFPFKITSGYRSPTHPVEAKKRKPGYHSDGIAVDIECWADTAYIIVTIALKHGFTGIGISQRKGAPRFIHLDRRPTTPVIYSY